MRMAMEMLGKLKEPASISGRPKGISKEGMN